MTATPITVYHLELTDRSQLRPKPAPRSDCLVRQAEIPSPELNRFLYTAVGGDWHWTDRLTWTFDRWMKYLDRAELQTWVLYVAGTPAGYFELEMQPEASVEIAYFGVMPSFIGQGLGGYALTAAVERAWAMGAGRVWLHTCTLDHESALANYLARGFREFRREQREKVLAPAPPGPWNGAMRS